MGGAFRGLAGPDVQVFFASDHGFTAFRRGIHLNHWLHAEGLLADAKLTQDGLTPRQRRALKEQLDSKVREYAAAAPEEVAITATSDAPTVSDGSSARPRAVRGSAAALGITWAKSAC